MKNSAKTVLHEYENRLILISYEPIRMGLRYCVHIVDQSTQKVFTRMGVARRDAREGSRLCDALYSDACQIINDYDHNKQMAKFRAVVAKEGLTHLLK